VRIGSTYLVTHHFHPSASQYLYQVDVNVQYLPGAVPSYNPVRYRRIVDWDVPPDFHQYTTWGWVPGMRNDYVMFTSAANIANPDPGTPRADRGAIGYFTDYQLASNPDAGGFVELNLGSLVPGGQINFTEYYGAAPSESAAMSAISTVGAHVYNLGEAINGAASGAPITAIFAVDGSQLALACPMDPWWPC
jgi:hypothetical protein